VCIFIDWLVVRVFLSFYKKMWSVNEANRSYKHLRLIRHDRHVLEVRMVRGKKRNAMNKRMWMEIGHAFSNVIPFDETVRVSVLTGEGKIFSSGIDLMDVVNSGGIGGSLGSSGADTVVEKASAILSVGRLWQKSFSAIMYCPKPVIAAIQGGCFGAALEMVLFCDIRFTTKSTIFKAPEVDLAFAADVGGNQMIARVTGNDSLARELMMLGRSLSGSEALRFGLVSRVLETNEQLHAEAFEAAARIAEKSPVASAGVKTILNYSREHNIEDSLQFSLTWNAAMLQTKDTAVAGFAFFNKKKPTFGSTPSFLAPPLELPKAKL